MRAGTRCVFQSAKIIVLAAVPFLVFLLIAVPEPSRAEGAPASSPVTTDSKNAGGQSAESGVDQPTREQLEIQISILQDYIKRLESGLNDPAFTELQKAYVGTKKKEYEYLSAVMDVNLAAFNA
jgi:hypothetical protein